MGDALVALTYGRALYEAASQRGKADSVLAELEALADVLRREAAFRQFLQNPSLEAEKKKAAAEAVFGETISGEMLNFLYVLLDKGRIWHLDAMVKQYRRLYDADRGIAEGKILSAAPLLPQQAEEISRQVSALLQKKVCLREEVDRSLIGGVKIQVEGRMIDRSLKSELKRLEDSCRKGR